MKIRNSCDMSTCARQNRNGMCARLSLIRLNCSYEEALCPCLPIKRIAKKWSDWADDRAAGLYDFSMLWTRTAPSSPWLKDEHVQLSEMCFRRFWARRKTYVVQKAPILVGVGSTGPVFAPYWSARLAVGCSKARTASARPALHPKGHLPKPVGYTYEFTGPKIGRTHSEPGERMWQLHRRRLISYGLPTDHSLLWLLKSYEPGNSWVSCMRPKH